MCLIPQPTSGGRVNRRNLGYVRVIKLFNFRINLLNVGGMQRLKLFIQAISVIHSSFSSKPIRCFIISTKPMKGKTLARWRSP